MEVVKIVEYFEGLAVLVVLFGFFYGPWQTFCISLSRQYVFELRDAWFNATVFEDKSLRDLEATARIRERFNSAIEVMDVMTWPIFFWYSFLAPTNTQGDGSGQKLLSGLPHGEPRKLAMSLLHCMAIYCIGQALARSIIFLPAGIALLAMAQKRARNLCDAGNAKTEVEHFSKARALISHNRLVHRLEVATIRMSEPSTRRNMRANRRAFAA